MIISENKLRKEIKKLLVEYMQDDDGLWDAHSKSLKSYQDKSKYFEDLLKANYDTVLKFVKNANIEGSVKSMLKANSKDPNMSKYIVNKKIIKKKFFDKPDVEYDDKDERSGKGYNIVKDGSTGNFEIKIVLGHGVTGTVKTTKEVKDKSINLLGMQRLVSCLEDAGLSALNAEEVTEFNKHSKEIQKYIKDNTGFGGTFGNKREKPFRLKGKEHTDSSNNTEADGTTQPRVRKPFKFKGKEHTSKQK